MKANIFSNDIERIYLEKNKIKNRKDLGQFFTPYNIALFMIKDSISNIHNNLKILDPACGLCIFQRAYNNLFPLKKETKFINYDIDRNINKVLKKYKIVNKDYLLERWSKNKFDFIISNPPYKKHINIENKQLLNTKFNEKLNFNFKITMNYYCYFILKSLYELKYNGVATFIVPYEFLNSNYGEEFKSYIIECSYLEEIMIFDNSDCIFNNALTTTCILKFKKINHKEIIFSKLDITNNKIIKEYSIIHNYSDLNYKYKWKNYFTNKNYIFCKYTNNMFVPFNTYAKAKRGIATGCNNFFIFNDKKIKEYNLPIEYFKSCLTSSNQIHGLDFTEHDFLHLKKNNKKIWLIYLNNYNMGDCKEIDNYIELGEYKRYNEKYITKNRNIWYHMENISIGDILVGTFSRKNFKFIKNTNKILNLTCFHLINLKLEYKEYLDFFMAYFISDISQNILKLNMREIGNGLFKVEPNDINDVYLPNIHLFNRSDIEYAASLYIDYAKNMNNEILKNINNFFNYYIKIY